MAAFTKPVAFIRQAALFFKNSRIAEAYALSKEAAAVFPEEMLVHFLLAKAAFQLGKYDEAAAEGQKAFNLAHAREDLRICALLAASAQLMLGRYETGYRMLKNFEEDNDMDVEELLLLFSAAAGDVKKTEQYAAQLMKINARAAAEFLKNLVAQ